MSPNGGYAVRRHDGFCESAGVLAMTELSRYVLETLWKDGDLVLSRSTGAGDPAAVLVLAPASQQPEPGIIARLEHTYALREKLDPSSLAWPLRLVQHRGLPALLMEDHGGTPLARLLGSPWELPQFLRVAIGVAVALGRIHSRGLIHRDVSPAKILVNPVTGRAWLIGTSFVSRLPRRQVPAAPEEIAGTLAYMAPEQTGRMNRSIDARSDLYSFGVTLYEMLTGTLPFTATDPIEWVHCHIARHPVPPNERLEGISEQISAIIMKLLSKTAEKRYQTAAGVAADLQSCLSAWDTLGRMDWFPLGTHDMSDRLLIPEKLYGRDSECKALLDAFDRVVASGKPELVLVSGYSGIGKSSVVNELHKALVPPRGLFAACKFDRYKRDIPYATLARAFQALVRQILGKDGRVIWADVSVVFVPSTTEGTPAFFASVIVDITERKLAEEELRQKEVALREAQIQLAHVSRVTTMGELAASIAHEVNQPLAGIVTNANASLRWLASEMPDLNEARGAIRRIIRDGNRAGDVISRMRALFQKARTVKERLDINEAIEEVVILAQSELRRNKVSLRTELAAALPPVGGDRVQLQQVVLNLILNGIEAMSTLEDRARELIIMTERGKGDEVCVAVRDLGLGLDPQHAERMFEAFYTTKPGGLGVGLAISRSIVENHGGRLWAMPNDGPGATFQFTLLKCP